MSLPAISCMSSGRDPVEQRLPQAGDLAGKRIARPAAVARRESAFFIPAIVRGCGFGVFGVHGCCSWWG